MVQYGHLVLTHTFPGPQNLQTQNNKTPPLFFKKWGSDIHSIAASFSNRVLTRLDVNRYQLAVIGFRCNLNQKDEGDILQYFSYSTVKQSGDLLQ